MQRGRHVWVQSPQHLTPPNPGLVIDERRWSGVTYYHVIAVLHHEERRVVIQRWYHQDDVRFIRTRPTDPDPGRWWEGWRYDRAGEQEPLPPGEQEPGPRRG